MSTVKLHQIIALATGKKTRAERTLTGVHHTWKNGQTLCGISRVYTPKNEEGDKLPPQHTEVQVRVQDLLKGMLPEMADYYDIVATQEYGNTQARADVMVDGKTLIKDAPVGLLLFLEKRLVDLRKLISDLPTLPADRDWKFDDNRLCYVTDAVQTAHTKKQAEVIVKYEATEHHPAQTELFTSDNVVGTWTKVDFSGAIPRNVQQDMMDRVEKVEEAVKDARARANNTDVEQKKVGMAVLEYVFSDGQ